MSSEDAHILPLHGPEDPEDEPVAPLVVAPAVIATGVPRTPGLAERLTPFLTSSLVVVDREARVKDVLGPPTGLLGQLFEAGVNVLDFCHPDDLAQSVEFAVNVLGTEPGWEGTWTTRLRRIDGEWRPYDVSIYNRLDDPVIAGFVVRLEEAVKRPTEEVFSGDFGDELELEPVASALQIPIVLFGAHRLAYFANNAARELCGAYLPLLEQHGLAAIAMPSERDYVAEAIARRFAAPGETTITFHLDPSGTARRSPIIEAQLSARGRRRVHAVIATLHDVSERQRTEAELRSLANLDPLTDLPNRRALYELLEDRLTADPRKVGLLFVDLDGFKAVNDTYGHDVGDELLVQIGRSLRSHMRVGDVVGRIGGDEFVAIVHDVPIDRLIELGNRVLSAVLAIGDARHLPISASLGLAVGAESDTPRDLVRRADRAMYRDKYGRELSVPEPAQ